MIRHVVMWTLKDPADAPHFKNQLDSCANLVDGMQRFEVFIRVPALEANCDVMLYSEFDSVAALAAYQTHPHHQQISAGLGALRKTRSVFDCEI